MFLKGVSVMGTISQRQIQVAVAWWMNALRSPTFKTLGDEERGNTSSAAMELAEAMAGMRAAGRALTEDAIRRFGEKLAESIGRDGFGGYPVLSVDYGPCAELAEALEAAGIRSRVDTLPWKTSMRFRDGGVTVCCGYRAPTETLL